MKIPLIIHIKKVEYGQRYRRHMNRHGYTFKDYGKPNCKMVVFHDCSHEEGDVITNSHGRKYEVQEDGSIRRVN